MYELEPRLERIETNAQFAQIVEPNEMTAIVTLKLSIGNVDGMINVCLPYSTMENVIEKLYKILVFKHKNEEGKYKEIIETTINRTQIPIEQRKVLYLFKIFSLQVGDIVRLDSKRTGIRYI